MIKLYVDDMTVAVGKSFVQAAVDMLQERLRINMSGMLEKLGDKLEDMNTILHSRRM